MLDRQKHIEEVLEALWTDSEENGRGKDRGSLTSPHQLTPLLAEPGMEEALEEAARQQLVSVQGDTLCLTPAGRKLSRDIVRRHRLAERLFHDVLDIAGEEAESSACKIEHLLSPGAADSICILLGHPTVCPHAKPIPAGECCQQKLEQSRPLVIPATDLRPGEQATVAYLGVRARDRLDQLAAMGLAPGVKVSLQQRVPSFVLFFGETVLAMDANVLKEVYVKRCETEARRPLPEGRRWRWRGRKRI